MSNKTQATTPYKCEFDEPVIVEYTMPGGFTVITTGVVAIEELINGMLVIQKTDKTFARIKDWMGYDIQRGE